MNVQQALEKYRAMLQLEKATNTITRRSRAALVRSLSDEVLAEFSLLASKEGLIREESK